MQIIILSNHPICYDGVIKTLLMKICADVIERLWYSTMDLDLWVEATYFNVSAESLSIGRSRAE